MILLTTSLYIWLASGEKSLPFLARYLSSKVNISDAKFSIDNIKAGLYHNYLPYVSLKNLSLHFPDSAPLQVSSTNIKLNLLGIFPFTKYSLINFEFSLTKEDVNKLTTINNNNKLQISTIDDFLILNKTRFKKFGFSLTNTSFTILNNKKLLTVHIKKAYVKALPKGNQILIKTVINGRIENENIKASLLLDTSSRDHLDISGIVKGIGYKTLSHFNLGTDILENSDLKINIKFDSLISKFDTIDNLKFLINGNKSILNKNKNFDKKISIETFFIEGNCQFNCNILNIDQVKLSSGTSQIIGSGKLSNGTLNLNLALNQINIHHFLSFWPKSISTKTRTWLEKFLLEATAINSTAKLKLNLERWQHNKPLLPEEIQIHIPISNAILKYPETSPSILDIQGTLNISGEKIYAYINKAEILNSKLTNFIVNITDLPKKVSLLNIKGYITGPLQDVVDVAFIHSEKTNDDFKELIGNAKTNIDITIPLMERDTSPEEVDIKANSKVTNFATKLFKKHEISQGTLNISTHDRILTINGKAVYEKSYPFKINHEEFLINNKSFPYISKTQISTSITQSVLKSHGYSIPDMIGGEKLNANIFITRYEEIPTFTELSVDLTQNRLDLSKIGIYKNVGEPAIATFKLEDLPSGGYKVKEYKVSLPNLNSSGTIVLDDKLNIMNIVSAETQLKNSSFSFVYRNVNQTSHLLLKGRSIDLSNINFFKILNSANNNWKSGFSVETQFNQIKLKNDHILTNPKFSLKCDQYSCTSLIFSGNFIDGDNFELKIAYPILTAKSSNAGKALSSLGISPNIRGGSLSLHSVYSSRDSMSGKLSMNHYYLKKAPLLTRLISLSALTTTSGLISLLKGKGILFETFDCPFEYESGVIKLSDCIEKGPTITLQLNGTLNLNNNYIDINGTLIPANIINSIIDKIPFIGVPLSGGKDSGVIATNFTMKGDLDKDPAIFANPLSILTPGFLRGIFKPKDTPN